MKKPDTDPPQTPEQIATALEAYLAEYPAAVVSEDGRILFDLRTARYSLSTAHDRCTLHLWSDETNLVRRISAAIPRAKTLRLTTHKFGQARPSTLELSAEKDRRTPSTREATRTRFLKLLDRTLTRHFAAEGWRPQSFRTSADLARSFGPAYARGLLTRATQTWAVIAINDEESLTTIDGILTFGILWLQHLRESSKRPIAGLKLILPRGTAALTLARIAWLADPAQFQLYELDQHEESLTPRDPTDHGNLVTRLVHAPHEGRAQERFAESSARVRSLIPTAALSEIELRLRNATELAFLLHGLEFARIRIAASNESFNRIEQITFGAGPAETALTPDTEPALRHLVEQLCIRRNPTANQTDPLFRLQPERWLEANIRRNLALLDPHLLPDPIYSQVPAFAAQDRAMLDLLAVDDEGRLVVLEVKAEEDPQLALQGLDYWIRVRHHHTQPPDPETGLGDFQRNGYFPAEHLSPAPPRLLLVAPALRIHPATEVILRHFNPAIPWTLIALDEHWRHQIRPIHRKRHTDSR